MRHGLMALGFAMTAAAASSSAQAQAVTAQSMVAGRQAKTIKIRASAAAQYDSNVAKTSSAEAARQGIELADVIYTPSVHASAIMPVGRQAVFIQADVSYLFHQNNKQLDHDDISVDGGIGNSLGPCGTVLAGSYRRGRTQLLDRTLLTDVQTIQETKGATFGLTCSRPTGLGLVGNVGLLRGSTSNTLATNGDFETLTGSAGLQYGRPSSGVIAVQGTYSRTKYPGQSGTAGQGLGYELKGVSVHVERRLGARIQLGATVGYAAADALSAPLPGAPGGSVNFKGVQYSGDASYRASSRLQMTGAFSRQVSPSLLIGRSYEIQSSYSVSATYKIGSRLSASLSGQIADSNSGGVTSTVATALTDSRVKSVSTSLRYTQSDRLAFVLNAAHEQRSANDSRFEYKGERIGLTATANF